MKNTLSAILAVALLTTAGYIFYPKKDQNTRSAVDPGSSAQETVAEVEAVLVDPNPTPAPKKEPEKAPHRADQKPFQASPEPVLEVKPAHFSGVALPPQTAKPRPYAKPTLPATYWAKKYTRGDARQWTKEWHNGIYTSWFNGDSEEVAKGYITTWGPLGIRTYMHDTSWNHYKAFVARMPDILKTSAGEPYINAFEVIDVLPGSPAENLLRPGDLIVGMQNGLLRPAQAVDTPIEYQFQNERSLALYAGMKLDEAEGQGKISFRVLRNPRTINKPSGAWNTLAEHKFSHHGNKTVEPQSIAIPAGHEVRLVVNDGGNGIGSDGLQWEQVYLEGPEKRMPLHELKGISHKVGWGKAAFDPETASWSGHAVSEIRFTAPDGNWKLSYIPKPAPGATIIAKVESRRPLTFPSELLAQVQKIEFPIEKIGTFNESLPGSCTKTANIIAQQAEWLAIQQQDDGSWQRPQGYTSNHYDTAWAGLGLMATGDKRYDSNIKKAAHFLSFNAKPDGWAVPSASVTIFLSEYWLRYRDDEILPALSAWVNCLLTESLTGDFTAGHGHNPGYRGTGVSTGGSHTAAALAVAEKTPIHFDTTLLDRILYRVQELAPDGHVPYGRSRDYTDFKPAVESSATYSGRHGPYLTASLLHGGPKLFTENCTAMYAQGAKGGSDQGHATETLSTQWAFIAMAASDLEAYRAHLSALRWKIAMRRCFNGGFCQSAFKLEYAGGESLLDYAIRSGSWLVALCAEKQNLAITGAPEYRTKTLTDVPPIQHVDAVLHASYYRDWGIADAVLADKSPASLKKAVKELTAIQHDPKLREKLLTLIKEQASPVAKDIMAIDGIDTRLKAYLVEMLFGFDIRVDALQVENKPGEYELKFTQQFPLAGFELKLDDLNDAHCAAKGTITLTATDGIQLGQTSLPVSADSGVRWNNWHTKESSTTLKGPVGQPFKITADFSYEIAGIPVNYQREILFNQGEDYGNGEKQRKVINDRRVWVPGTLSQDHARWNISFELSSGQQIAAATQGNEILVHEGDKKWISPTDRSLQAGTVGEFCYTSGWQRFESRVPEFRIKNEPEALNISAIQQGSNKADQSILEGTTGSFELDKNTPLTVLFPESVTIRAFDLRMKDVNFIRVEAKDEKGWHTIHVGNPSQLIKRPVQRQTKELRIHLDQVKGKPVLEMLRMYQ